jgi:hypothetical protein
MTMDPDLPATDVPTRIAELLDSGCACVTLDRGDLYRALERELCDAEQRGEAGLRRIAIVDDAPASQYLDQGQTTTFRTPGGGSAPVFRT